MDDAGRIVVAEMILELRDMQARLEHLAIDKLPLEARNGLRFAISDLDDAIKHLLPTVANKP